MLFPSTTHKNKHDTLVRVQAQRMSLNLEARGRLQQLQEIHLNVLRCSIETGPLRTDNPISTSTYPRTQTWN